MERLCEQQLHSLLLEVEQFHDVRSCTRKFEGKKSSLVLYPEMFVKPKIIRYLREGVIYAHYNGLNMTTLRYQIGLSNLQCSW